MQFVKMDICKSTELQMKAEKLCLEGVEEFEKMLKSQKGKTGNPAQPPI
jgi:hypothetical protein